MKLRDWQCVNQQLIIIIMILSDRSQINTQYCATIIFSQRDPVSLKKDGYTYSSLSVWVIEYYGYVWLTVTSLTRHWLSECDCECDCECDFWLVTKQVT